MRVAKLTLILSLCAVAAVQAAPHRAAGPGTPDLRAPEAAQNLAQALANRSLFLRLQDLGALSAARQLELELSLDGERIVVERFRLARGAQGDYEILARRPDVLARLYQLAAEPGRSLLLTVRLDGLPVRELSFPELVSENRGLKQLGLAPRAVSTDVEGPEAEKPVPPSRPSSALASIFAKGYGIDPDCANACYAEQNQAIQNHTCDCGDCQYSCTDLLNNCLWNCPSSCSEPAAEFDFDGPAQLVGAQVVDYGCYGDPWSDEGNFYTTYQLTYKVERIHRVQHCDYSVTDTVIGASYPLSYCSSAGGTCYFPYSYPPAGGC